MSKKINFLRLGLTIYLKCTRKQKARSYHIKTKAADSMYARLRCESTTSSAHTESIAHTYIVLGFNIKLIHKYF